jgi:hypothetical protein
LPGCGLGHGRALVPLEGEKDQSFLCTGCAVNRRSTDRRGKEEAAPEPIEGGVA